MSSQLVDQMLPSAMNGSDKTLEMLNTYLTAQVNRLLMNEGQYCSSDAPSVQVCFSSVVGTE